MAKINAKKVIIALNDNQYEIGGSGGAAEDIYKDIFNGKHQKI